MIVIWSLLGLVAIILLVSSYMLFNRVNRQNPKPLDQNEQNICARIVDEGLGQPWICRKAVDTGECPCLPCEKLEKAKQGKLFRTKHITV